MIFTDNTIYSHLRTVKFPAEGLLYHIISTGVLRFSCNYLDGRRLSEAMPGGDAGRGGFVRRQSTVKKLFVQESMKSLMKAVM